MIVDLRNNTGGDSDILQPLIKFLKKHENDIQSIVFTGIDTYSSAIINLMDILKIKNSISIGEIPHGSPSHFGEIKKIVLPNSKLEIQISTKEFFFENYKIGDLFIPQYKIERTISDYLKSIDPCINFLNIH